MHSNKLFFNDEGRLRGAWRLAIFAALFMVTASILLALTRTLVSLTGKSPEETNAILRDYWFIFQSLILLTSATVVGWVCSRMLEGLRLRSLGWARHKHWLRDWFVGALIGIASILLAVLVNAASGGFRFALPPSGSVFIVIRTLLFSASIFMLAAAAEEALFRGYPLQTLLRSLPAWAAIVPSSTIFAAIHLDNPNVAAPKVVFINTALAGIWLAIAYLRTRSLWFPLGVHWGWNWALGALWGVPVSGITNITPAPLVRTVETGSDWLTGGAYGVEGGVSGTIALCLSIIFIWRTGLVHTTQEMKESIVPPVQTSEAYDINNSPTLTGTNKLKDD